MSGLAPGGAELGKNPSSGPSYQVASGEVSGTLSDAATATAPVLSVLKHITSAVGAAIGFGIGAAIDLANNVNTVLRVMTDITSMTNVTPGSEASKRVINLMKAGALVPNTYTFDPDTLTLVSQSGKINFSNLAAVFLDAVFFNVNLTANGDVVIGAAGALATTATLNFLDIPTCAGAPTGVPGRLPTGKVAVVYDTTNNKLWIYNGAWKGAVYA